MLKCVKKQLDKCYEKIPTRLSLGNPLPMSVHPVPGVVSGGQAGQGVTSESTAREPETIRADESFHGVVHPTNPSIIGGGPQPIPHSPVPSDKLVEFFTFLLYLPTVHV